MLRILGVSGTLVGSKTNVLVESILKEIKNFHPEYEVEMIDLKDYNLDFCDGRSPDDYNDDTLKIISKFEQAEAYVLGTSIIHGSIPGALKNLLDLVPAELFERKSIILAATGGNKLHYLAIENYLKPITSYLKMYTIPEYIFATSADFSKENVINNPDVLSTISRMTKDYCEII